MNNRLRFIGVTKDATTAGPGKRLELFTKGCIRGVINPCQGCFNESTWTFEGQFIDKTIEETVEMIERDAWNRQVTFCGGEPMLQAVALTEVAKKLKEIDPSFHIVMYTAYKLDVLMKHGLSFHYHHKYGKGMLDSLLSYAGGEIDSKNENIIKIQLATAEQIKELMCYIDIIVDGDYKHELRIPTAKYMNEGQFIGSNNQRVIETSATLEDGELYYYSPLEFNELYMKKKAEGRICNCCGHIIKNGYKKDFCNDICRSRYDMRNEEMKVYGGV